MWFWNTEIGWAAVHPLLASHGWEYVQAIIWDKGIWHIAGNVNGDTIRGLPTEICAFYRQGSSSLPVTGLSPLGNGSAPSGNAPACRSTKRTSPAA